MIIAENAGFFTRYGVDVEPVHYAIAYDALSDLAAGEIDGGLLGIGDAVNVANHTELKVVAISDNGGINTIISTPRITSLSDLKGKRIGVQLGTSYEMFVSQMLTSAGIRESDVTLFNIHPEDVPQALGSQIDAGYVWEPYTSHALARGNHIIFSSEEATGLFPNVITFQASVVKERPEDVRSFLKAWFAAAAFRLQNPDETRDIIASQFGLRGRDLPVDPYTRLFNEAENQTFFQQTYSANHSSLFTTTKVNAAYLLRIGVLTKLPDFESMLDPSYLQ
jgi:NitT/TauT family transport system substrate-binding protein